MSIATILQLDALNGFGLLAVSLMLAFYAMEDRSRHFVLLFAGACVMGSAYGFMQGAWPFGLVEGVWSLVALRKWSQLGTVPTSSPNLLQGPHTPVDAFLEDLLLITSKAGPTTYAFPGESGEPRGYVQLYRPIPGRVLVHRLWAVSPGNGTGSHMMQTLCELADHHGVEIALRPLPFGSTPPPLSAEQLRQWYHRHGFAGDRNMVRRPVCDALTEA